MKFIYIDAEGNQQGPVDQVIIERAIRNGELTAQSAVRNSLLKDFRTIAEFECFAAALKEAPGASDNDGEPALPSGAFARLLAAAKTKKPTSTAFVNKFRPASASASRRLMSALFDFLVLLVVALIIYFPAMRSAARQGKWVEIKGSKLSTATRSSDSDRESPPAASGVPVAKTAATESSSTPAANLARRISKTLVKVEQMNADRNAAIERETGALTRASQSATAKNNAPEDSALEQTPEGQEAKTLAKKFLPQQLPAVRIAPVRQEGDLLIVQTAPDREFHIDARTFRSIFWAPSILMTLVVLLYYALSLAIFAQTVGMWYWGIFLTRHDIQEVYFLRALIYSVLLVLLGVLMIPMVYFFRRSAADLICGVRQIGVASASSSN